MSGAAQQKKRQVTQATFDETVRENMEEFEMDRAEAVADAVKQFTSQGVDLSNICVTADAADEEWLQAHVAAPLAALTAALDNGAQAALPEPLDAPAVLAALEGLTAAVGTATGGGATEEGDGEGEEGEAACGGGCCSSGSGSSGSVSRAGNAKKMAAAQGVMNMLGRLWGVDDAAAGGQGRAVLLASLALAEALLTPVAGGGGAEEAELRDSLWPTGMLRLCEAARSREGDVEFLMRFLPVVRLLAAKCEDNKVHFSRHGGLELLLAILRAHGADRGVVCGACGALRSVTAVDDFRKDFSASHTHTRALVSKGAIPLLVGCARRFEGDLEAVGAALASLRNLANNDESVGQIAREGGLEMAVAALEQHVGNAALARTVLSVFRNVSADDQLKAQLCTSMGGAALLLRAMQAHPTDAKVQEHGLATVAAMALRSPENAGALAARGGIPVVLQGLRGHPQATAVQRQGALAVRNLVSRNPALAEPCLDAGAEPLLRHAGRFQESVDEAYAALRDLGCEVRRVVLDRETGQARDAVEQFGQAKTNFRPCFETSNDVEGRIAEAAVAPAAGGGYRF